MHTRGLEWEMQSGRWKIDQSISQVVDKPIHFLKGVFFIFLIQ